VLCHGSLPEIQLSKVTFASDIGCFDLYKVLRPGYPVYHAEMTRRIPAYVAENMDELIQAGTPKIKTPAEFFVWGKKRRFMGAYPVIEVPDKHLSPDSPWVSQDQLAREEICHHVLDDAKEALSADPRQTVYVIDFGGGVGNLPEVLSKKIYGMPDEEAELRELLKKRSGSLSGSNLFEDFDPWNVQHVEKRQRKSGSSAASAVRHSSPSVPSAGWRIRLSIDSAGTVVAV